MTPEMQAKIDALTKTIENLQAERLKEKQEMADLIKEHNLKSNKKIQNMEIRLNETRGHSIYAENEIEYKNIQSELPDKFTLDNLPKFQGTEDPVIHVKAFKGQMSIKGVKKDLWPILFPHSLEPPIQRWFYSLNSKDIPTWEDVAIAFSNQYCDNMDVQASTRTLECLTQRDNEGFSEYLTRWKATCSQLPNRPHDSELIGKFINNLRPIYQNHMRYAAIDTFRQATTIGMKIEDDLRNGILSKFAGRGYQGSNSRTPIQTVKNEEHNAINVLDILSTSTKNPHNKKREKREFTPIRMTYAEAFKKLSDQGLIQPTGPTEDPATKPAYWDDNAYCLYHRGKGHDIEKCFKLKHKIQDLIDSGELTQSKSTA